MKGVILAGGSGTRLRPATTITNKHLLPVHTVPMILFPLNTLLSAGIRDILIVTGPQYSGHFLNLLGSGKKFDANFNYSIQEEPKGIAHALAHAEDFAEDESLAVILGDNIFAGSIDEKVREFQDSSAEASIFLRETEEPERFGNPKLDGDKIVEIEEKPDEPHSPYAMTGLYFYEPSVFDIIRNLKPSDRGEYEISDVNNKYIERDSLTYQVLKGFWSDAGTPESFARASEFVRNNMDRFEKLDKVIEAVHTSHSEPVEPRHSRDD